MLSIGGSDPTGESGIQADIRAMTQLGAHPTAVITAVTVQSERSFKRLGAVGEETVSEQLRCLADHPLRAIKSGLLPTDMVVSTVARDARARRVPLVVAPVLAVPGGGFQADSAALRAYRTDLLPVATVLVCDLGEAEALVGVRLDRASAVRALVEFGVEWVVLRDSGPEGEGEDMVSNSQRWYLVRGAHHAPTRSSTCLLSAALTARVAQGHAVPEAAGWARQQLTTLLDGSSSSGGPAR